MDWTGRDLRPASLRNFAFNFRLPSSSSIHAGSSGFPGDGVGPYKTWFKGRVARFTPGW